MKIFLSILAAVSFATTLHADGTGGIESASGHFRVAINGGFDDAAIGAFLGRDITIVGEDGAPVLGAVITVGGGMPGHGHGLPTRPDVAEIGEGRYRVEGLRFTMPGRWFLLLEIDAGGETDTATIDILL